MPTQQLRRVAGPASFGLKKASVLSLFTVEEFVGVLIPLALIALYWLVEVSK
ncbi:hypothetical protein [Pseudomonas sp. NW5]|uniref:hypothetical protein n=1 Tax=Pseudomonas sp. NW5 TaxID=2934934 RepID=UPI00202241E8|nr:hypothetical protein [Pseudomonas sp. NW5]MCL7462208.1 hypothetical protein [Pseudomonas sp. NW5]